MSENVSGPASAQHQATTHPPDADHKAPGPRWVGWVERWNTALAVIGGIAVLGMMVHIVGDVIARALTGEGLPDTFAVVQFVWMPTLIALGLGYALVRGEHLTVDLLTASAGARVQRVIEIVAMFFAVVTVGLLGWFAFSSAQHAMEVNERAVGASSVSIWPYRWVVVIGLLSLALQAVAYLVRAIVVKDLEPSDGVESAAAIEEKSSLLDQLEVDTKEERTR